MIKIVKLTSLLPDMPHLSSPRPRLRHDRRLAHLSHLNLTLNLSILFFVVSLALLPHLLTYPTVPFYGSRLRSSPTTRYPDFLSPIQRPCAPEPKATFLSSVERRSLRSLIRLSASPSPPLNFLRLTQTSLRLLPLAQTKLLTHAKVPSSFWHGFSFIHFQPFLIFAFLSYHL